ncbi:hypothetical protein ACFL5P_03655 [candidate division KSB1 bacterium]
MKCCDITEIYQRSLRGDLSRKERSILENHFAECKVCRETYKLDNVIITGLKKAEPVVPGKDFSAKVFKRLHLYELPGDKYFLQDMILYAAAVLSFIAISFFTFGYMDSIQSGLSGLTLNASGSISEILHQIVEKVTNTLIPGELVNSSSLIIWMILMVLPGAVFFAFALFFQNSTFLFRK